MTAAGERILDPNPAPKHHTHPPGSRGQSRARPEHDALDLVELAAVAAAGSFFAAYESTHELSEVVTALFRPWIMPALQQCTSLPATKLGITLNK